ncbi:MAG: exodeoxyribonuclease VII large subunit [Endomicrobiia bacterium]|nr:exodeoxyribonuclease VII large subunit [Endomicrobiaceae bacterium]MDD3053553.1 exodeoxyribonuclease VII large subunit [Endomicrobiaceae bacterium]MDD3922342.1 exodeoxyribonuclease VII large subunit [Endomicrobiaceae bacterium]
MVDLFDFESSNNNIDDGKKIYSVSEINNEIKFILEDSYPVVWISGEVSNFKTYSSGHMYFNLKDENSQISAVMFSGYNQKLNFVPKDGMQILVFGKITSYVQRGSYQIQVSYAKEIGIGTLQEIFEKLKNKLQLEGLFEQKCKKQIPYIVNKIGIVTSKDGAALHDILSVLNRRFSNVEILIYPVRVQGEQAKYEISNAIEYLNNNYKELDVLLVGRGGGSLEDLWAFNEEIVARAIFNSKIPTISCVGHEIDFTIADFVADLRAATPSVAAEIVAKNRADIEDKLLMLKKSIIDKMTNIVDIASEKINKFKTCRALSKPYLIYEDKIQYIDEYKEKLINKVKEIFENKQHLLQLKIQKLSLLSPLNILERGYSVCFKENGELIKKSKQILKDDIVNVKLSEGIIKAKVL